MKQRKKSPDEMVLGTTHETKTAPIRSSDSGSGALSLLVPMLLIPGSNRGATGSRPGDDVPELHGV